jgi:hypothetical protein
VVTNEHNTISDITWRIREALANEFPGTRFSVRAVGGTVKVLWATGLPNEVVDRIIRLLLMNDETRLQAWSFSTSSILIVLPGVGHRTLCRWLAEHEAFQAEFRKVKQEVVNNAVY